MPAFNFNVLGHLELDKQHTMHPKCIGLPIKQILSICHNTFLSRQITVCLSVSLIFHSSCPLVSYFSSFTKNPKVLRIIIPCFAPLTQYPLSFQSSILPCLLPSSLSSISTLWGRKDRKGRPLYGDPERKEWISESEPITTTGTVQHFYYGLPQETIWANFQKLFDMWVNILKYFLLLSVIGNCKVVSLHFYGKKTSSWCVFF